MTLYLHVSGLDFLKYYCLSMCVSWRLVMEVTVRLLSTVKSAFQKGIQIFTGTNVYYKLFFKY